MILAQLQRYWRTYWGPKVTCFYCHQQRRLLPPSSNSTGSNDSEVKQETVDNWYCKACDNQNRYDKASHDYHLVYMIIDDENIGW
jgi:RNase P subunit RPR2